MTRDEENGWLLSDKDRTVTSGQGTVNTPGFVLWSAYTSANMSLLDAGQHNSLAVAVTQQEQRDAQ